jgi:hypothetical protein
MLGLEMDSPRRCHRIWREIFWWSVTIAEVAQVLRPEDSTTNFRRGHILTRLIVLNGLDSPAKWQAVGNFGSAWISRMKTQTHCGRERAVCEIARKDQVMPSESHDLSRRFVSSDGSLAYFISMESFRKHWAICSTYWTRRNQIGFIPKKRPNSDWFVVDFCFKRRSSMYMKTLFTILWCHNTSLIQLQSKPHDAQDEPVCEIECNWIGYYLSDLTPDSISSELHFPLNVIWTLSVWRICISKQCIALPFFPESWLCCCNISASQQNHVSR